MKDIAIKVEKASVGYSHRIGCKASSASALDTITFDLYKGETLGVVGRNGAGKSTLLKLLSGIISPDEGHVSSNVGQVMMLSLQAGFLPYMTGEENSMLNGMLLGAERSYLKKMMPNIREYSGLGNKFYEPISTYSTGMKARLGFSIAITVVPDVMMIDEVMGVGDEDFRQKSNLHLREYIASNKTVVLTSHNAATIRQLCDRVIWLRGGELVEIGDANIVIDRYEEEYRNNKKKSD